MFLLWGMFPMFKRDLELETVFSVLFVKKAMGQIVKSPPKNGEVKVFWGWT